MDDAVRGTPFFQRTRGAGEPSTGPGGFAIHEAEPDPKRSEGGGLEVADFGVRLMNARENGDSFVVAADQEGDAGERLLVLGLELAGPIRLGQGQIGPSPGSLGEQGQSGGSVRSGSRAGGHA